MNGSGHAAQSEVKKKHKCHAMDVEVGSQCSARNVGPAQCDVEASLAVDTLPQAIN